MHTELLRLPSRKEMVHHIITSFGRYWPKKGAVLSSLPIKECECAMTMCKPVLVSIDLPEWAANCGVGGALLIPSEACPSTGTPPWQEVDWWLAVFLLLEAWHERMWERVFGSVHSYSMRLNGWDDRIWDRAWANRIVLFLRRWGAHLHASPENELFGPLPRAEILMTHDVDAVEKTGAIRLKQSLFMGFNAFRAFFKGEWRRAGSNIKKMVLFLSTGSSWWFFDEILALESAGAVRPCFNFSADGRPGTLKRLLFDPQYDLTEPRFIRLFEQLRARNALIGLHPTFDSWRSAELMEAQKLRLESACGVSVRISRQHWLRFAWESTLVSLEKAGIELDTTLMFNDRSGFRTSSALRWKPFNHESGKRYNIEILPSVLMDSHFYDYNPMTEKARRESISFWIREVESVRGQIALLWHPHTLSPDYGWKDGFMDVLDCLGGEGSEKTLCT